MTLQRALLLLVVVVLAAALIPAGVVLDRRLAEALVDRSREDLERAPMVLKDRWSSISDVRMMHARDLALADGLASAVRRGDLDEARLILGEATLPLPETPVLVVEAGVVVGPPGLPPEMVEATRRGEMPVSVVRDTSVAYLIALAPVRDQGEWLAAAGGVTTLDRTEAATLAGLTRSEVVIFSTDGTLIASSGELENPERLARALAREAPPDSVTRTSLAGHDLLVASAPLEPGVTVAFLRDLDRELAVVPDLRATAAWSTGLALVLALALGALFAGAVSRPVRALAAAADRFRDGDVAAPLPSSAITEVERVADAFGAMREALSARLEELQAANRELEDRQERLALLQAELVQRERLAATGHVLAQLAHEVRNPVASVRNCLEVVRRKGDLRGEAAEFADMAVDELLRMHELAERMLDLHRPRPSGEDSCDVTALARDVAALVRAGADGGGPVVHVVGEDGAVAEIPGDALKQVLLNLVLNAREVTTNGGGVELVVSTDDERVRVEVLDRGPGIPEDALGRIFDPFFTTKDEVHGVGLGLFTAEGLVRTHGGTLTAANRDDGPGARFVVDLPAAS